MRYDVADTGKLKRNALNPNLKVWDDETNYEAMKVQESLLAAPVQKFVQCVSDIDHVHNTWPAEIDSIITVPDNTDEDDTKKRADLLKNVKREDLVNISDAMADELRWEAALDEYQKKKESLRFENDRNSSDRDTNDNSNVLNYASEEYSDAVEDNMILDNIDIATDNEQCDRDDTVLNRNIATDSDSDSDYHMQTSLTKTQKSNTTKSKGKPKKQRIRSRLEGTLTYSYHQAKEKREQKDTSTTNRSKQKANNSKTKRNKNKTKTKSKSKSNRRKI